MSTRNNPITSHDAYKALTPEKLNTDYGKIVIALRELKEATYEELSDKIGFADRNAVSRRLSEMEAAQLIYKPGTKKKTSRNRDAFTYKLINQPKELIQKSLFD